MKTIKGETFEILLDEDNSMVSFTGALRLTGIEDYTSILEMLKNILVSPKTAVVLDLTKLDFLNSSGITMFSRFVIEARGRADVEVRFLASRSIPWHARSLKNLQRLMPSLGVDLT